MQAFFDQHYDQMARNLWPLISTSAGIEPGSSAAQRLAKVCKRIHYTSTTLLYKVSYSCWHSPVIICSTNNAVFIWYFSDYGDMISTLNWRWCLVELFLNKQNCEYNSNIVLFDEIIVRHVKYVQNNDFYFSIFFSVRVLQIALTMT